jgi:alginate O-acetyltransferase complex protein AlgI
MGSLADASFQAHAGALSALVAWLGLLAYAFQIYFDFSAYSDMAIGLGRLFGFRFVENFNSPYKSASITEFWRRWHISLSSFLRDYLYIPLGGNRKGERRTYVNLLTVMLLGGLWHGAQWTFVAWGAIHGLILAWERWQGKDAWYFALTKPLRVGVTFLIILAAWVFFRADSFGSAAMYFRGLVGLEGGSSVAGLLQGSMARGSGLPMLIIASIVVWAAPTSQKFLGSLRPWKCVLCLALAAWACAVMFQQGYSPFLYFQF